MIRTFRGETGTEQGICRLFEECHGRTLPQSLRRWRYASQGNRAPVTTIAVESDKVVAHVSALPVTLKRGSERIEAGLWVDLMVAPAHRNLTLFLELSEYNLASCAQKGLKLVFAFPNDRSYPVLKRMLDWEPVEEIDALEAPLDSVKPPELSPNAPTARKLFDFTREFEELRERLAAPDAWTPARTESWLNWRYRRKPGADYPAWSARGLDGRLLGWLVVKVFDGPDGVIGDILDLCAYPEAEAALLREALAHFRARGVDRISAWALRDTPSFERLCALGLAPKGPRTHFAGRWTAPDGTPYPAEGRKWRVCKGDSDVF